LRGRDLEQLGRNAGLSHFVVFEGEILMKLLRVVGRVLSFATIRALCSDARASRTIWKTWY